MGWVARTLAAALAVLACDLAGAAPPGGDPPPAIARGRDRSAWRAALGSDDPAERREAVHALAALADAVGLAGALDDPDTSVRRLACAALRDLGWAADPAAPWLAVALADDDPAVRRLAAEALALLPDAVDVSAGALAARLGDAEPSVRLAAAQALARLPVPAEPALTRLAMAAGDEDARVRLAVAEAFGAIAERRGLPSAKAARALAPLFEDPLPAIRLEAARALGRAGADARPAIDLLLRRLIDQDAPVRRAAAEAIASARPRAEAALGPLTRTLREDPDQGVRRAALVAIGALQGLPPEAAEVLAEALAESDDLQLRRLAAGSLGQMRAGGARGVRALAEAAADPAAPAALRIEALRALAEIGAVPEAREAVPALLAVLQRAAAAEAAGPTPSPASDAAAIVSTATAALLAGGPAGLRALAGALDDLPADARLAALDALHRERSEERAAALAEALRKLRAPHGSPAQEPPGSCLEPDPLELDGATEALVVATLAAARRLGLAPDPLERERAAAALGRLAPAIPARASSDELSPPPRSLRARLLLRSTVVHATHALASALRDTSPAVRREAARALGLLGESAGWVASDLIDLLGPPETRAAATEALLAMGNAGIDALAAALAAASPEARLAAVEALAAAPARNRAGLGWLDVPAAIERAVPALGRALRDPAPEVRLGAARALAATRVVDATGCLVFIGRTAAAPARGDLLGALADVSPEVRLAAARVLLDIDDLERVAVPPPGAPGSIVAEPAAPPAVRAIVALLACDAVAAEAAGHLAQGVYERGDEVRAALAEALRDPAVGSPTLRASLTHAGEDLLLFVLDEAMAIGDDALLADAAAGLARSTAPPSPRAIEVLQRAAVHPHAGLAAAAARALAASPSSPPR